MDASTPKIGGFAPLLRADEPAVAEVVNAGGNGPFFLLACHAGRAIPAALGTLGVDDAKRATHIGWDIGVGDIARRLAEQWDAPAVLASYSRLVIDLNRFPGTVDSIPAVSDGTVIPGNRDLDAAAHARRVESLFWPYHNRIAGAFAARWNTGRPAALVDVHTFTPCLNGGTPRPWDVGIVWNRDDRLAAPMIRHLREQGICVGDNEPYSGRNGGFCTEYHAGEAGLPHVGIEVRQDQAATPAGAERWAALLADALGAALRGADWLDVAAGRRGTGRLS